MIVSPILGRSRLRRREAEVLARLAGRLLQQNGDQDVEQGEQDPERGIDLVAHLADRAQRNDPGLRVIELLAQEHSVHRRHHSATTTMITETTARRSAEALRFISVPPQDASPHTDRAGG